MPSDSDHISADRPLRWYAIAVRPRHDKSVAHLLRAKGYHEMVPLYHKRSRYGRTTKNLLLPLFPGYVFCEFDDRKIGPILDTPGVIDIVRAGRKPVPLDDGEIASIQKAIESELPIEPCPWIEIGQRVTLTTGPLRGLSGLLLSVKGSERLVLSVSLLRRSVSVEVDRSSIDHRWR